MFTGRGLTKRSSREFHAFTTDLSNRRRGKADGKAVIQPQRQDRPRRSLQGTYTDGSTDCTGTITLGGIVGSATHWDVYLTEDRKRGHMIRMDEGNMAVRSFEK